MVETGYARSKEIIICLSRGREASGRLPGTADRTFNQVPKKMKYIITLFLSFLFGGWMQAQPVVHERLLSFENDNALSEVFPEHAQATLSGDHYKDGQHSLSWSFAPGGSLRIKRELGYEPVDPTGKDTYLSTFIVWVYNEKPMNKSIRFEFLKNGKTCAYFPFNINFTGWRAAWVCYERDMQGTPEVGMNEIRIVAPDEAGELFIDHLITATKTDHRYQSPDRQVPFVNQNTQNHWLLLLKMSTCKPDIQAAPLTDRQKSDIQKINTRFERLLNVTPGTSSGAIRALRDEYMSYRIATNSKGGIVGVPLFYSRAAEAYERLIPDWKNIFERNDMELRNYFTLMKRTALAWNNSQSEAEKTVLKDMFVNLFRHAQDQGVAYGSCLGIITHYGYSFRNFFSACYLMREVLAEAGLLDEADQALRWYAMTNEVFIRPEENGMDMDAFNTLAAGRFSSIMLMPDSPEKVQYLRSFSRWINNGCLPAKGLQDAFKIDGSAYHHCNNYPAYAIGGLDGATDMIYLLSQTEFAISEWGHSTVKKALMAMRFYCNKTHFPLAMSGRHPDGRGQLVPTQYARLALAGSPDGKNKVDPELAAAYLRLVDTSDDRELQPEYSPQENKQEKNRLVQELKEAGGYAESDPQGNISMPYGCLSVQRRGNWAAVVRGHSRYLWAAEHYLGANRYGRYLAHASLQILTAPAGKTVTPETGGWIQKGFDWGRIPGTTAIHLPVEKLEANVLNVDKFSGFEEMLYSDEAFAGGLSQRSSNGIFGMKLHEHDKYNGSHRARKSFHFFDDVIVCLGSNIENENSEFDTETTLFQQAVTSDSLKRYWERYRPNGTMWVDPAGTGYYIPKERQHELRFEKNFPQYSRMQNTGENTAADWVTLFFEHGKAPRNASYEYAVLPAISPANRSTFGRKPSYQVLQHDSDAHIVRDRNSHTTSYVLFEKPLRLPRGWLAKADTSCLVMLKESGNRLTLTVANPDLALYRGSSDDIYDKDGKRVERSIYSRPWINNESGEIPVHITLKGFWKPITETKSCRIISADKKETVLLFFCKDGSSYEVDLEKK